MLKKWVKVVSHITIRKTLTMKRFVARLVMNAGLPRSSLKARSDLWRDKRLEASVGAHAM